MKSSFKLGTKFSTFLLIAVVSCSVSKVEICEMCGREVCVCDGVETPPDTDDDGGTGIPAPMPTGSNFITLKNSKMYLPDGNEARLWGVNFQTVIFINDFSKLSEEKKRAFLKKEEIKIRQSFRSELP